MGYEFKVTKKDQELASGERSSTPTNPTDQESTSRDRSPTTTNKTKPNPRSTTSTAPWRIAASRPGRNNRPATLRYLEDTMEPADARGICMFAGKAYLEKRKEYLPIQVAKAIHLSSPEVKRPFSESLGKNCCPMDSPCAFHAFARWTHTPLPRGTVARTLQDLCNQYGGLLVTQEPLSVAQLTDDKLLIKGLLKRVDSLEPNFGSDLFDTLVRLGLRAGTNTKVLPPSERFYFDTRPGSPIHYKPINVFGRKTGTWNVEPFVKMGADWISVMFGGPILVPFGVGAASYITAVDVFTDAFSIAIDQTIRMAELSSKTIHMAIDLSNFTSPNSWTGKRTILRVKWALAHGLRLTSKTFISLIIPPVPVCDRGASSTLTLNGRIQHLAELLEEIPVDQLHRINVIDLTSLLTEVCKDKEDKEQAERSAFTKIFVKQATLDREEIVDLVYFRPDVVSEICNWWFKMILTTNHRQNDAVKKAKSPYERVLVNAEDWHKDLKHKF